MKPITSTHLEIFGKSYELLTYNIRLSQNVISKTGEPNDIPTPDSLYLEIVSDREDDFVNWMLEHDQEEDGDIIFKVGNQTVKTISFSGAYLVGYSQNPGASGSGGVQITEDLTISFKELNFGDAKYERPEA